MAYARDGRILVVDDDGDVRDAVRDLLEDEGYEVGLAVDGLDALAYLRTQPMPSLILLDWNMAPMNGPAFITELAKEPGFGAVPIVLLTADLAAPEKAKTNRCAGYLRKPVELDLLFDVANRFARPASES
jgi:CheY-like chemotaxis protein